MRRRLRPLEATAKEENMKGQRRKMRTMWSWGLSSPWMVKNGEVGGRMAEENWDGRSRIVGEEAGEAAAEFWEAAWRAVARAAWWAEAFLEVALWEEECWGVVFWAEAWGELE